MHHIKTNFAKITIKAILGTGEITIESVTGLKIIMNIGNIELSNGAASVKLTPSCVSINDGALEVI